MRRKLQKDIERLKEENEELRKMLMDAYKSIDKIHDTLKLLIETENRTQRVVAFLLKDYESKLEAESNVMYG